MLMVIAGPTIEAGESLSEAIDCTKGRLVSITMPADWTPAPLTFQFSADGENFSEMFYLDGHVVKLSMVVPGAGIVVSNTVGDAVAFLKVRSGTLDQPVIQSERREFAVILAKTQGGSEQTFPTSGTWKADN